MLLKLKDGGIKDINIDNEYESGGCPTCDYGSRYINNISFIMTEHCMLIECQNEYDYSLSEGEIMKIILPNIDEIKQLTELQFIEWIKDKINNTVDCDRISFK